MPLLMAYMTATAIQEAGTAAPVMYDPVSQTAMYDARIMGTHSLRYHGVTRRNGKITSHSDPKNESDDTKTVK
jgi:putative ATP-grasp target RiPP